MSPRRLDRLAGWALLAGLALLLALVVSYTDATLTDWLRRLAPLEP